MYPHLLYPMLVVADCMFVCKEDGVTEAAVLVVNWALPCACVKMELLASSFQLSAVI